MKLKKAFVTVKEFKAHVNCWCKLRETMQHQQSSIAASRKDLGVFIRFCKEMNIRQITGFTLIKFCNYLRDVRKNCSGSINRKRTTLRCYFDHLCLKQVNGAKDFPIKQLPRARQPYSGPITALEPKETIKLLDSIDRSTALGLRDFTLFSMLYALGLRISEVLNIALTDIDWQNSMITINGKGRKIRKLPLTDKVKDLIKKWISFRVELYNSTDSNWLFLSRKGNQLSQRMAQERFAAIVKNAGPFTLKKVTPHSLRHAFASHAVDGNADILVVKAIMGHASLKTTEIYLHPSKETLRNAVNNHLANDFLHKIRISCQGAVRINHRKTSAC